MRKEGELFDDQVCRDIAVTVSAHPVSYRPKCA